MRIKKIQRHTHQMKEHFEQLLSGLWNRVVSAKAGRTDRGGIELGHLVIDGEITTLRCLIPTARRAQHLAVLGKTGSGKSYLLRNMVSQDIHSSRGFVFFDLHGDVTPFVLRRIAVEERRRGEDLSDKLIVVEPADLDFSIGLNVIESRGIGQRFVNIAEVAQVLKQRWHLEALGARTTELLRNTLVLLADNGLTVLEAGPVLTDAAFRAQCLRQVRNSEVTSYFHTRYDQLSEPMRGMMREPILNKISEFTADERLRHLLGQRRSTFSFGESIDQGRWIVFNLDKSRLGEQAATLGSLLMTKLKNSLFSRSSRDLVTIYCDELQSLVAYDGAFEILFSESRKFGVSVVSANQFLDQFPPPVRSAILSIGTHIFFQLSSVDADRIAVALDGGRSLSRLLKNLPPRQAVVRSGHHRWQQVRIGELAEPTGDYTGLYDRCRNRWARRRGEIEREIESRQAQFAKSSEEVLHDWD